MVKHPGLRLSCHEIPECVGEWGLAVGESEVIHTVDKQRDLRDKSRVEQLLKLDQLLAAEVGGFSKVVNFQRWCGMALRSKFLQTGGDGFVIRKTDSKSG